MVALAFTPWIPEPEDPFSKRKVCTDSDTYSWSGVSHTFVLQLADFSLHNVAERTPWSVPQPVQFVPGSNMLITPWDSLLDGQCHLDVYSPHDWQRVARISHSETGLDARMAFSPDGQLIAIGLATHVCVYGLDGKLQYKLHVGGNVQHKHCKSHALTAGLSVQGSKAPPQACPGSCC